MNEKKKGATAPITPSVPQEEPHRAWVLSYFRAYSAATTRMAEPGPEHFKAAAKVWPRHAPADLMATILVYFEREHWFTKDRRFNFMSGYLAHIEDLISALPSRTTTTPRAELKAYKTCDRGLHEILADQPYCRYCAGDDERAARKAAGLDIVTGKPVTTPTEEDEDVDFG